MNTLKAEKRDMTIKAKKLRREGFVTGCIFGREMKESIPLKMTKSDVEKLLKTEGKGGRIRLEVDGEPYDALIKEVDYNPLKGGVDEIDFQALVSTEKVHSSAEIHLINADKLVAGVPQQMLHEVDFKALPSALVEKIELDVGDLKVGDTIRVSLTEAPENEIPVAQMLVAHFASRPGKFEVLHPERYSPTACRRRSHVTVPVTHDEPHDGFLVLESASGNPTAELRAAILNLDTPDCPVIVKRRYEDPTLEAVAVKAAADLGPLLLDGLADGLWIDAPGHSAAAIRDVELMILQAARVRFSHTEYIACPSCGRTLYDIEKTLADIKARTSHPTNLRIGVMGCIVNGPGEMADADYGYVGAAPGRITLYKGREVVARNIPQEEALDRLIALIRENGDWTDAPADGR